LGHRGVELVLNVLVGASDDPSCLTATHGTVTVFASYYQKHYDSVRLRFNGGCAPHNATFLGSHVYALIANNGHQVN
jgi:hypothetical protein